MPNVIIYTKTGCPWCEGALEFLDEHKIKYENREVLGSKEYFDELVKKSGQNKTPTLDIDGLMLADSDRDQIEVLFKENGWIE